MKIKVAAIAALRPGPCEKRWAVFRAAYPRRKIVTWREIFASNGGADLWWLATRLSGALSDRDWQLLAADCAEHVLPLWEAENPADDRPRRTIEVVRRFARGEATAEELAAAAAAMSAAAMPAAWSVAACSAAWAARSAAARAVDAAAMSAAAAMLAAAWSVDATAARSAAEEEQRVWQAERLLEYLETTHA